MRPRTCFLFALSTGIHAMACSSSDEPRPATPEGYCGNATASLLAEAGDPAAPDEPLTEEPVAGSACNAVVRTYPIEDSTHVGVCTSVSYGTNPPSSGHHYPMWPAYAVYKDAIPRGFWVHSLEHGGVVITYSCDHCDDEVRAATALVQSLPVEPTCCSATGCGDSTNRMLLTPDPGLGSHWAASAWGVTLTADCFEQDAFEAFANEHRGSGPENICSDLVGFDVTRPAPSP